MAWTPIATETSTRARWRGDGSSVGVSLALVAPPAQSGPMATPESQVILGLLEWTAWAAHLLVTRAPPDRRGMQGPEDPVVPLGSWVALGPKGTQARAQRARPGRLAPWVQGGHLVPPERLATRALWAIQDRRALTEKWAPKGRLAPKGTLVRRVA